jgi:NADPH2:quinone reductase
VVELPDGLSTAEGAGLFVNPLTALSMVETMRAEGHNALVHTAVASNLGQMLVRICAADGIGLVNIVRRAEQAQVLRDLGAVHVVDSSQPDFADRLTGAIRATGATLAFDAIGGGSVASEILTAMERAQPPLTSYTPYGTGRAPSCPHDRIRHSRQPFESDRFGDVGLARRCLRRAIACHEGTRQRADRGAIAIE